ncbi:30S ribosomal protein S6 [Patescibacteria group bacterium]|nr:30S ribosomal protein S6 [Patescibacteria group bacterium]
MQNQLNHYEFTFIIPGNAPESDHQQIFGRLKSLLEKNQAQNIAGVSEIGRRKLSYPVKQLRHGFYFTWELDLPPQNLAPAEKELKINKDVLRYLLVKKRLKTAAEVAKEEKVKTIQIQQQLRKEKEKEAEAEKKEKTKKEKVSLDDLDKKLDELLSGEIK